MSATFAAPVGATAYPLSSSRYGLAPGITMQPMTASRPFGTTVVRPITPTKARPATPTAESPDVAAGVAEKRAEISDKLAIMPILKPLSGTGSFPAALEALKFNTVAIAKDPQLQALALSMGGGGLALGAAGGAGGMAVGGATGAAVGIVPALFTFGLSIPAGAVVGGTLGTVTGAVVGGSAGIATGGLTYKYRVQIKEGMVCVQARARDVVVSVKLEAQAKGDLVHLKLSSYSTAMKEKAEDILTYTRNKSTSMICSVQEKGLELKAAGYDLAKNRTAQVTAASAAAGGVALGTAGGAVGLATGGLAGAAVGLVPALFTFGLSIPVCACIGAASGGLAGCAAGGSIGAVGGGAAGNRIYTKRESIKNGAMYIKDKAQELPSYVPLQLYGA